MQNSVFFTFSESKPSCKKEIPAPINMLLYTLRGRGGATLYEAAKLWTENEKLRKCR